LKQVLARVYQVFIVLPIGGGPGTKAMEM